MTLCAALIALRSCSHFFSFSSRFASSFVQQRRAMAAAKWTRASSLSSDAFNFDPRVFLPRLLYKSRLVRTKGREGRASAIKHASSGARESRGAAARRGEGKD